MSRIQLSPSEVTELEGLRRGSTPVRVANRARILLLVHEGCTNDEVAHRVGCGTATVKRVLKKQRTQGLERALHDAPRPGRERALTYQQTQELIALACSKPPEGRDRWTVSLLTQHFRHPVGRTTVHRILQEDGLKPWREKNVVRSHHR